jgi:hypothetical protein
MKSGAIAKAGIDGRSSVIEPPADRRGQALRQQADVVD